MTPADVFGEMTPEDWGPVLCRFLIKQREDIKSSLQQAGNAAKFGQQIAEWSDSPIEQKDQRLFQLCDEFGLFDKTSIREMVPQVAARGAKPAATRCRGAIRRPVDTEYEQLLAEVALKFAAS